MEPGNGGIFPYHETVFCNARPQAVRRSLASVTSLYTNLLLHADTQFDNRMQVINNYVDVAHEGCCTMTCGAAKCVHKRERERDHYFLPTASYAVLCVM